MHKLASIQYLRAIACLAVLMFHLCEHYNLHFKIGAAGADAFFIISGFIIWLTTYTRTISPRQFLLPRLRRLVPLYWLATLATAAVATVKPQFFYDITAGPIEVLQSLLFIPYYSPSGEHIWPTLIQGWTLNIEMFFYLAFAALLGFAPVRRLYLLTGLLGVIVAAGIFFPIENAVYGLWTNPFLLELVAGMWLGFAYTGGFFTSRKPGLPLIAIALLAFAFLQISQSPMTQLRLLLLGVPAFMLVTGFLILELHKSLPPMPALVFLGNASYSIYLWHNLFIIIIGAIFLRFGLSGGIITAAAVGTSALVVSLLAYRLIERPLMAFIHPAKG